MEALARGRNELIGSKILTDISSINLDQAESVSEDVVLCALIVKFGTTLIFAIAGVALSLRVLPGLFRKEVLKILFPNVDVADLCCLYKCVQKLSHVLMILIIHPKYSLLPVIDVYASSHSCKATRLRLQAVSFLQSRWGRTCKPQKTRA